MPREFPILFSPPMIRALLDGKKFVTRRLSPQWDKVKAGDRLWVRETWYDDICPREDQSQEGIYYYADDPNLNFEGERPRWRPSIHMPRWASRILLEVEEDTRQEKLQDITEEDAIAEGLDDCHEFDCVYHGGPFHPDQPCHCGDHSHTEEFARLWQSLHTKPGERWEDNPTVRRVGRFRRIG